jgi:hypothetical protein
MARRIVTFVSILLFAAGAPIPALGDTCNQMSFLARPIPMGVSGGNIGLFEKSGGCCTGTLGSLVQNSTGTKRYILSNNHVLARTNKAPIGSKVVQPGLGDNSCIRDAADSVGNLSSFAPIRFSSGSSNTVDAAVAITSSSRASADILNIGAISETPVAAALDMAVQKMGRTTCRTFATVSGIDASIMVGYPGSCRSGSGTALFINQILIDDDDGPFSAGGDSGSLVVTDEECPRAVGLLFAGGGTLTVANPIGSVLTRFKKKMVGGCTAPTGGVEPLTENDAAMAVAGGGSPTAPTGGSGASQQAAVNAASAVKSRHDKELFFVPGAVGTAIGRSKQTGQIVIKLYLEKETAAARAATPSEIEGVPVEIEVTGPIVAY